MKGRQPLAPVSAPGNRPKIGLSTQVILRSKWYKHVFNLGVDTLEINRRNSKLYFAAGRTRTGPSMTSSLPCSVI
jgi:hypothetical protein